MEQAIAGYSPKSIDRLNANIAQRQEWIEAILSRSRIRTDVEYDRLERKLENLSYQKLKAMAAKGEK